MSLDFDCLRGLGDLRAVVGVLLMFVLIVAVLMRIVSEIVWAVADAHGNYASASNGRTGVLGALGSAVLSGGGVGWMTWLLNFGHNGSDLWASLAGREGLVLTMSEPAVVPRYFVESVDGCRLDCRVDSVVIVQVDPARSSAPIAAAFSSEQISTWAVREWS